MSNENIGDNVSELITPISDILDIVESIIVITPSTEQENSLKILIYNAIDEFKYFTKQNDVSDYYGVIAQMVVYNFNRMGTEGLNSENYSGVAYNYSSDYPEPIVRQLKHCRKLVTL